MTFAFPKRRWKRLEIHASTDIVGWQCFFKHCSLKQSNIHILPENKIEHNVIVMLLISIQQKTNPRSIQPLVTSEQVSEHLLVFALTQKKELIVLKVVLLYD